MKFYGTPNMLVKERKRKPFSRKFEFKPLFRFSPNGEYETDDPKLIERLKRRFEFENTAPEGIECRFCGGTHKNRQGVAACAKKRQKEVV
jgi:hypothetical protein